MESSNDSPVEGKHNVVLTCESATTDNVTSIKWYKDNKEITSMANNTYSLPGNRRANSGSYQCEVVTKNVVLSSLSDVKNVTFLCKLLLLLFY